MKMKNMVEAFNRISIADLEKLVADGADINSILNEDAELINSLQATFALFEKRAGELSGKPERVANEMANLFKAIKAQEMLIQKENPVIKIQHLQKIVQNNPNFFTPDATGYFNNHFATSVVKSMETAQSKLLAATNRYKEHCQQAITRDIDKIDDLLITRLEQANGESIRSNNQFFKSSFTDAFARLAALASNEAVIVIENKDWPISSLYDDTALEILKKNTDIKLAVNKYSISSKLSTILSTPASEDNKNVNPLFTYKEVYKQELPTIQKNRKLASFNNPDQGGNAFIKAVKGILFTAGEIGLFFKHTFKKTEGQKLGHEVAKAHKPKRFSNDGG